MPPLIFAQSKDPTLSSYENYLSQRKEFARLASVGDKKAVKRLIEYLKAPQSKASAIWALGWIGSRAKAALPALEPIYEWELEHGTNRRAGEAIDRIAGCKAGTWTTREWEYFVSVKGSKYPGEGGIVGEISNIEKPQVRVIDNEKAMRALWKEMGGQPSCQPEVDFSQEMVVAFFDHREPRGISSSGFVDHHLELKYECHVRTDAIEPAERLGTAYRLVVIDKPTVPIQVFPASNDKMPSAPQAGDCSAIEYAPAASVH